MNGESKIHWDQKYEQGLPSLTRPDPFFLSAYARFAVQVFPNAGTALDIAGGLGRHALWLAQQNWQVSVVDVSEVALRKLGEAAKDRHVDLGLVQADAADYSFEPARFDLIVLFYHLDRRLFPRIVTALKPGGLFFCKLRAQWASDASPTAGALLGRNELALRLPEFVVLDQQQRPVGDRGVVEYVGRKPTYAGR
jgi:SAM-dependent methyltransferase